MKKGEAKKGQGETKGDTEKLTNNAFFGGKRDVLKAKKGKEKTNKNKNKNKNKEGLGPSEVALWATSPDP